MLQTATIPPAEFQDQLDRARRDGVTVEANLPFFHEAKGSIRGGILLVHGLTATPREMSFLAEELSQAGFCCLGIRLPGHGTSVDDLRERTRQEWLTAVEEGYLGLLSRTSRIYGIGVSTGGLLLLQLAANRKLAGAVVLSPFLRPAHWLAPAAGLVSLWMKDYPAPQAEESTPFYYDRRPLRAVAELNQLCREVGGLAPDLKLPVLAVNAQGDLTVNIGSGLRLFKRLGGQPKEYHLFDSRAGHVLSTPDCPCFPETVRLIRGFLDDRERDNANHQPDA